MDTTIPEKAAGESGIDQDADKGGPQRLRREDPGRTAPLRQWSNLYRRPDSWGAQEFSPQDWAENGGMADDASDAAVSHGVKLGYRVVEEHIRQGRRVAQQLNPRPYGAGSARDDIGELFGRIIRSYTDLGSLWTDLFNAFATNPEFLNSLLRVVSPPVSSPSNGNRKPASPEPASGSMSVSVEIISTRPSQVTVDLHPNAHVQTLGTSGLYAAEPNKPPLTDITFEPSFIAGQVLVRIRIPEGQAADVYSGVIVDKKTNLPQGTLSVRISSV